MFFDPRDLIPVQEPTHAARHRQEYLTEKTVASRKDSRKKVTLPVPSAMDVQLLRAEIAVRIGRFMRFA